MISTDVSMIDHDRLFKELLSTFFLEFLQLFLPQVAEQIEPESVEFLPQEYFTDLTAGEKKVIDLLAQVRLAGQEIGFLIHVEAQSCSETDFARRMFFYFARLHQKYLQPIYPVVIFSFDQPLRQEPQTYQVEFKDLKVMEFNFAAIQLNSLNWQDFLNQPNPIAAALMAKMQIAPQDRPKVKAECLRLLATLQLDPAKTQLISGFVDTYLRLNAQEEQVFQAEIGRLEETTREGVMQIVTSWTQQGIEQGIEQGVEQGERAIILRQLTRRFVELPDSLRSQVEALPLAQIEALGDALLDFQAVADLAAWLQAIAG
jgi:predicted transposase/invertase (TIGR01784 family)